MVRSKSDWWLVYKPSLSLSHISCCMGRWKGKGTCCFLALFKMVLTEMWQSGLEMLFLLPYGEMSYQDFSSGISFLAFAAHLCFVLWTIVEKATQFKIKIKTAFNGRFCAPKGIRNCFETQSGKQFCPGHLRGNRFAGVNKDMQSWSREV